MGIPAMTLRRRSVTNLMCRRRRTSRSGESHVDLQTGISRSPRGRWISAEAHRERKRGSTSISRSHHIVVLLACACALSAVAHAQVVRQSSWLIQDPEQGLRQELAETVIAHADEWLTRENPEAPIARLDDRVRITVIDEIDQRTG